MGPNPPIRSGGYEHHTEADRAADPDRAPRSRCNGARGHRELLYPLRNGGPARPAQRAARRAALLPRLCGDRLLAVPPLSRQMALRLAAGFVQHFPRLERARRIAPGARLHPARPEHVGRFLLRQDHDPALLVPADVLSRRATPGLPVFPLHARAPPRHGERSGPDPDPRPRGRCGGALATCRERRAEENLAGRYPLALAGGSRPMDAWRSGSWRSFGY